MQINIKGNPFGERKVNPWDYKDIWPSKWITINEDIRTQRIVLFKLEPQFEKDTTLRVHIAADQRYKLYLNGAYEGAGNERGNVDNWYFESYDLDFKKGKNSLEVLVWHYGDMPQPWAQISLGLSFILAGEQTDILNTGTAPWKYQLLDNIRFIPNQYYELGAGPNEEHNLKCSEASWREPFVEKTGVMGGSHIYNTGTRGLKPAELPPQIYRKLSEFSFKVPKGQAFEKIIDLKDYYCFYPALKVIGGKGDVKIYTAESLFEKGAGVKGQRDKVEGKEFKGNFDIFHIDGACEGCEALWWKAGRFIKVEAVADEDMEFSLILNETRYPFEPQYEGVNKRHKDILKICLRTLQMCCHETFMDCPVYEQVAYIADTRVAARIFMKYSNDLALIKKAVYLFGASADLHPGFPMGGYPAENCRVMPAFSLLWVGMLYDYIKKSEDISFLKQMANIMRKTLNSFLMDFEDDKPVKVPSGWNFIDAIPNAERTWILHSPDEKGTGTNSVFNLILCNTLLMASELEDKLNEPELSSRYKRMADSIMKTVEKLYWDDEKKLFSDDYLHICTSEHAQILALMCDNLDKEKIIYLKNALIKNEFNNHTNLYFKHYLFEVADKFDAPEIVERELKIWDKFVEDGFSTVPEHLTAIPRSDCHAWSASPALLDGKYFL